MNRALLFVVFLMFTITTHLFSGTTGKIAGIIKDAESGEPLPGANIQVEGTVMGAFTDVDGFYVILNIPPGNYTLRASMIGFTDFVIQ